MIQTMGTRYESYNYVLYYQVIYLMLTVLRLNVSVISSRT